jgi:NADH-quinone oxidoreductase subunit H
MNFAWKFMLPLSLINLVVAALWHYSASWNLPGGVISRWLFCGALVAAAYVGLAKALTPQFRKRVYRYAS